jgi:hypothetical protein
MACVGGDVSDVVGTLVEPLDDVGDEVRVEDRGTDLGQSIDRLLLEIGIGGDGDVEEHVPLGEDVSLEFED